MPKPVNKQKKGDVLYTAKLNGKEISLYAPSLKIAKEECLKYFKPRKKVSKSTDTSSITQPSLTPPVPDMNRAQRRAIASGKGPKSPRRGTKRAINLTPMYRVIQDRQIMEPKDYLDDLIQTELRYQRLCQGGATTEDFDEVALRLGMALNRAHDIDDELVAMVQESCAAMDSLRNRYFERGTFVMTGLEKQAIRDGLDYLEKMVCRSTRAQMHAAWRKCLQNIDAAMTKRVKLGLPALPTKEHP